MKSQILKILIVFVVSLTLMIALPACSNGEQDVQDILTKNGSDPEDSSNEGETSSDSEEVPSESDLKNLSKALISSENLGEKYTAFGSLLEIGPQGLPTLLDLYKSADLHTKYLILMVIKTYENDTLKADEVIPVLLPDLKTTDMLLLGNVLTVLVKFEGESLRPYAADLLPVLEPARLIPVESVSLPAVLALGSIGTDDTIPLILEVINLPMGDASVDKNKEVRAVAAVAMSQVENKQLVFDTLVANLEYAKRDLSTQNTNTKQVYEFQYSDTVNALKFTIKDQENLKDKALRMADNADLPVSERKAGIAMLSNVQTNKSKNLLMSVAEDESFNKELRSEAIFSLVSFLEDDSEVETLLVNLANLADRETQIAALIALAGKGRKSGIPVIETFQKSSNDQDRRAAIMVSKYYPEDQERVNQILMGSLGDRTGDFNLNGFLASIILYQKADKNPAIIPELLASFSDNSSSRTIEGILETLVYLDPEVAREAGYQDEILQTTFDLYQNHGDCSYGSSLLGEYGPDSDDPQTYLDAVVEHLSDPSCLGSVLKAIGKFGSLSLEYLPTIVQIAQEGSDSYRGADEAALEAIGFMGEVAVSAVPDVSALTASDVFGIPAKAVETLGFMGEAAVPELIKLLSDEGLQMEALAALQEVGSPAAEALAAITGIIEDDTQSPEARAEAVFALFAIDPDSEATHKIMDSFLNSLDYTSEAKDTGISKLIEYYGIEMDEVEILDVAGVEQVEVPSSE
jgi:hypothetical protein